MQSLGVGQLHWAPPLGWQEQAYWKGLAELRAAGRVREVGLSNYGPKGVSRAHRFLAGLDTPLASNQVTPLDIATFFSFLFWAARVDFGVENLQAGVCLNVAQIGRFRGYSWRSFSSMIGLMGGSARRISSSNLQNRKHAY